MNSHYSSWNTFLQQNIANSVSGNGDICLNSLEDISIFNKSILDQYQNDLTTIKFLHPGAFHEDNNLVLFCNNLQVDDWQSFKPIEKSTNIPFNHLIDHPNLNHVHFIKLSNSNLQTIKFNHVKCIDWLYLVWNSNLTLLESNATNTNSIFLYSNDMLKNVELPSITSANYLSFSNLKSLKSVNLQSLQYIKTLNVSNISSNEKLHLKLDSLKCTKTLRFYNVKSLTEFKSPVECVKSVLIENNENLLTIDLVNLKQAKLVIIKGNKSLTHVNIDNLVSCCKLIIEDCPQLKEVHNSSLKHVYKFLHLDNCNNLVKFNQVENVKCAIINTNTESICRKPKCDTFYLSTVNKCFNVA